MSRAQILAMAAAVSSQALSGCADTVTKEDGNAGQSGEGGSSGAGFAGRSGEGGTSMTSGTGGASGVTAGSAGVAGTLGGSGGMDIAVPEYGGAFPIDSGLDEDGGVDEMNIAIYSAPNPRE